MARRIDKVLLQNKIIIETTGTIGIQEASSNQEWGFYVDFENGANAGVVKIETADDPDFTGTWAVLATVTFAADNAQQYAAITGVFRSIRVRISTAIGAGGDVTVRVVSNQ